MLKISWNRYFQMVLLISKNYATFYLKFEKQFGLWTRFWCRHKSMGELLGRSLGNFHGRWKNSVHLVCIKSSSPGDAQSRWILNSWSGIRSNAVTSSTSLPPSHLLYLYMLHRYTYLSRLFILVYLHSCFIVM